MDSTLKGYIVKNKRTLLYFGMCIVVSILLTFLARSSPKFSQWYGETISPIFVNTLGRLFSPLPFSVFEFLICAAALGLLATLFRFFYLASKSRPRLKKSLWYFCCKALCVLGSLLLLFTLTASINYSKPPLSAGADTSLRVYSRGELLGLSLLLTDELTKLADAVQRDDRGLLLPERDILGEAAIDAMKNLGERYPALSGYYPAPKPVFLSGPMSYLGITGIFSPFTLEANYNRDVASFLIPYTLCHELAHLKGFMREDEAGFLAYLACRDSDSVQLQYSGALNAFLYTMNQLYGNVDRDLYDAVYTGIPKPVREEISRSREYWQSHTATVTSLAKKANNKYLMANAQTKGTESYGMMVDLLLKEYDHRILREYGDRIPQSLLDNSEAPELN